MIKEKGDNIMKKKVLAFALALGLIFNTGTMLFLNNHVVQAVAQNTDGDFNPPLPW